MEYPTAVIGKNQHQFENWLRDNNFSKTDYIYVFNDKCLLGRRFSNIVKLPLTDEQYSNTNFMNNHYRLENEIMQRIRRND